MHAGKKSSKENEIYQKPGNASKMEKMQQETMQPFKTCMGKKKPENMRAGKKSITEKKNASANNATFEKMHFGKIHMREKYIKYGKWKYKLLEKTQRNASYQKNCTLLKNHRKNIMQEMKGKHISMNPEIWENL